MTIRQAADVVSEAWASVVAHRLRAALSLVGVVTGVGTVVAALAVADGARRRAVAEIGALGIDNVIVRAPAAAAEIGRPRRAPEITLEDARALGDRLPGAVVSALKVVGDSVAYADRSLPATIAGVTPEWSATAGLEVALGRWFDARDAASRTAVVGDPIARALFDDADPIGQRVLAAGEWRVVVGVLPAGSAGRGRAESPAADPDRCVFVPVGALDLALGAGDAGDAVQQITVRDASTSSITRTAAVVASTLAARHDGERRAFEVVIPQELLQARLRAQRGFHLLLLAIGALVLLVSGVGIMNILAASVTERTAEIGLRRACGARRSTVRWQFAAEAALLTGAGGAIGIPAGLGAAVVAAWLAGWPVAVSAASLAIAMGLAVSVGLAAGIYPAHMAASLTPVDALRQ